MNTASLATIPVGFEVGTGAHVDVPLCHLVITGETQESGKITQRFDPLI